MISCSQDVWLTILDPGIEYPDMAKIPIIMQNVIKNHINYNVFPVVDTSYSHDEMFLHLHDAIEYDLLLG